jgi:hypothetical protein
VGIDLLLKKLLPPFYDFWEALKYHPFIERQQFLYQNLYIIISYYIYATFQKN